MSGYPQGSGYPYGAPPSQPYGAPPQQPYGAASSAPPYGAPPTQPYGAADPYGKPAKADKPPKDHQGGGSGYGGGYGAPQPYGAHGGAPPQPYGAHGGGAAQPYGAHGAAAPQPYGAHGGALAQPYGAPGAAPYGKPEKPPKGQQSGGYDPSAPPAPGPYGASPFAALVPSAFPPGTDPSIVACFQAADQDGSGFIDDKELQRALSSYNQSFSIRTVHLLMYLFTSSNVRKIGAKEFTSVFYSLQNWRAIFERSDRDRSGRIDVAELRDALLGLGFAVSPTVLDLLVSKFDKSGGRSNSIEYDNFIECCLTVKGLTEKFKEKDVGFTGSATFDYESFMLTVLPFLIA